MMSLFRKTDTPRAAGLLARMRRRAGFTLIELLVTLGIMMLISAIILGDHNRFGGSVLLQNLAYDVALSVRQAQVYGISVRRFGSASSANFDVGYGVHFDLDNPTTYVIFGDAIGTPNGLYDTGEAVNILNINQGYRITQLCTTSGAGENCAPRFLDVLFIRPEPDALISGDKSSCVAVLSNCRLSARIIVASPRGATMAIQVFNNGQIAIQQNVTNI